ncbi:c-di-GMP-binding flagellar brake protein YcgR [Pseudomonas nitritireducens]|uniref:C-di-GMP-binding flagellar brake protein YcgR n=1 Tax=Pseudomonas nitroreducens TaxID=46680 RepID=A0A7W7P2P8_PSENT|nr:flagellar brake protein [Pseudomonas nitritireducens]MBB4866153.1 c-di-GMP-binding flagellar brake protein YcgR [Pseudomonas nitritireducens]
MSNLFVEENGPQPPKTLKAPVEIHASLRTLMDSHDPLLITFEGRSQRFQSFVVEVNRERNIVALDELIPNDGERFLQAGEDFRIEGFHEGVRIAWECKQSAFFAEIDGARCYWLPVPEQMLYHQRRNAFRAPVGQGQPVPVEISGSKLKNPVKGNLIDISATGCKIRLEGNVTDRLQPGQVYEQLTARLPFGAITVEVELRHVSFEEKVGYSFAGVRFHQMSGLVQRNVERFVYQLQREARRFDKDELF